MIRMRSILILMTSIVLSGCVAVAKPLVEPTITMNEAVYPLPADYDLPPYIRIVNLPLVTTKPVENQNTTLLSDYWLFSKTGYTLVLAQLPNVDAAKAFIRQHQLLSADVRVVQLDTPHTDVTVLSGLFTHEAHAIAKRESLAIDSAQVMGFRALKAKRCQGALTDTLKSLCTGAPVRTLTLVEGVQ